MAEPNARGQFNLFATGNITAQEVTSASAQRYIEGLLCSISPNGAMSLEEIIDEVNSFGPNAWQTSTPRVTLKELNEACKSANMNERGVVVVIASSVLQPENTTECNHFVVLNSCDVVSFFLARLSCTHTLGLKSSCANHAHYRRRRKMSI